MLSNQRIQGIIREMGLCLKNVKEKLGNLANTRDNQGKIRENVYFCFFNQLISKMLGKLLSKQFFLSILIIIYNDNNKLCP